MLEKLVRLSLLLDFYGALLTERQRRAVELHVHEDWSLGEIAGHLGVSRQAVHDLLRRAEETLEAYDRRLGLIERFWQQRRALEELEHHVGALEPQLDRWLRTGQERHLQGLRQRIRESEQALRRLAATV